jgi:ABC-type dipeptide/oligopeptide/nickel transport system ATPase component
MNDGHLISVENLKTYFFTFEGVARAVDDVSFHLDRGEVLGIVGESGCGKSVTAQTIMRLIPEPPGRIVGGHIRFDGRDLAAMAPDSIRNIRGKRISMIFQEPMTSLNPVFTIGNQISEMFVRHEGLSRSAAWSTPSRCSGGYRFPLRIDAWTTTLTNCRGACVSAP